MSISIDLWWLRIRSFCQNIHFSNKIYGSCYKVTGLGYSMLSSCIIALLLLCAGIEPHIGPTAAKLVHKLYEFIVAYEIICDQLQLSAFATRLDEEINSIRFLLTNINATLLQLGAWISMIESGIHLPTSNVEILANVIKRKFQLLSPKLIYHKIKMDLLLLRIQTHICLNQLNI